MASLGKRANGRYFLRFIDADGKRKTVALSTTSARLATSLQLHIENLLSAASAGHSPDPATAAWLAGIKPKFREKLEHAGVIAKPPSVDERLLQAWLDSYVSLRSDVKGSTATVYGHARRCLIGYFGAEKPIAEITPGDCDAWRIWLADHHEIRDGESVRVRLSENTVKRRCGIAKQFFRAAQRRKLIPENPFADMRGIATQRNRERFYFVTREDAQKVIDSCPDAE